MTTLEATAKNKVERIKDFYDFRGKRDRGHAAAKLKRIVI
jgi:hypothetical protein